MSSTNPIHAVQADHHVPVAMRDGVILRAEVYRPQGEGKWPVIVERFLADPADHTTAETGTFFSQHGYVYVYNNIRGTVQSEGEFFPLVDDGWGTNQDGYDTVEWAARQPWSNGKVGMYGGSYGAFTQYVTFPTRPPSLKAGFAIYGSHLREVAFPQGIYRLEEHRGWANWMALNCLPGLPTTADQAAIRARINQTWAEMDRWHRHLPLRAFPPLAGLSHWYFEHLTHPAGDPWWAQTDSTQHFGEVDVPVMHVGGWYDMYTNGTLGHFLGIRAQGRSAHCRLGQRLLVGPWAHWSTLAIPPQPLDFGPDLTFPFQEVAVRWFDHWLKGEENGVVDEAAVRVFLMGENRWLTMDEWPPAAVTFTPFYLHQGVGQTAVSLNNGNLTPERPTTDESPDHYTYDPQAPIIGYEPSTERNQLEQQGREGRLLTYTSALLTEAVTVVGPVQAIVYAASSAPDTDWFVRLCDVLPDGRSIKVCEGMARARYRTSLASEEMMTPGQVYRFTIVLNATAQTFLPGHRLRVHVTSSDFPQYERNFNTGGPFGEEVAGQVAINTIFHDRQRPSHIVLPIMASQPL